MKTLSNLTPVEIFTIIISAFIAWSMLKGAWRWLFKKRKQKKVKKEFQITVFMKDEIIRFSRADVKKWSCYDENLIKITKSNGDKVWFNGFPFVVDTFVTESE